MNATRRHRLLLLIPLLALLAGLLPPRAVRAAEVVATVAGSFQSELGCPGDWQPQCDRSLMRDPDGDGTYTFSIPAGGLPIGAYEYKVALDRAWDASYPANNLSFRIAAADNAVTFSYDSATNAVRSEVTGSRPPGQDDDLYWDGLGHDSRSTLYRAPGGAVVKGTRVAIRFRTYHMDATGVTLRTYDTGLGAERLYEMRRVAADADCYDEALRYGCDLWQATIDTPAIGQIYYRFVVRDGAKMVYYEDDSDVRDGGWGKPSDQSNDWGWALTVYDPSFRLPIRWMKRGVVYQIFPDRFANGDLSNDPRPVPGNARLSRDPRYAYPNGEAETRTNPAYDQMVRMRWGELPEGYCRNYQDITGAECPKRFAQPGDPADREQPRGRDYYGGDLEGVAEKLDYLKRLGVTVIYFNPIFAAGSNHRYDTRDFKVIDPYLGDLGTWKQLERGAKKRGMRIILDGVFNHMSSDAPIFDRYHNWSDAKHGVGACESVSSPYRSWFRFRAPRANEPTVCAPYTREGPSYYESWAGFDSLPQLSEEDVVKRHIYAGGRDSIARYWIDQGADGWRLDVMQDKSIPFWEGFRAQVKAADPDAIIIGELWKKFDVLPYVLGNTADTAMNYRLRDAAIGLLAPGAFDPKGFPGSGSPITPSTFRDRLESVREDYPDAAYYSLMNLLDSHDTERLLWTLTPGAENRRERERDAANVAEGKRRQRLAALIQFTQPGAPTVYYGDEVALTGDDDPDDRRTYPWGDRAAREQGDLRQPDRVMYRYYAKLASLRRGEEALIDGPMRFLLADDDARTVAYARSHGDSAFLTLVNASERARTLRIPVSGVLPNGTRLEDMLPPGIEREYVVRGGVLVVELAPLSGALLRTVDADLSPPAAPRNLRATADGLSVSLSWSAVRGVAGYNVYRSPVSGGGYVRVNGAPVTGTTYRDASAGLRSGQRYYYVVRALDRAGNESRPSNEAAVVPGHAIDWANLQHPPTLAYTVSARNTTDTVYGQVYIAGVTNRPGPTPGLVAQLGYGPQGSDPRTWNTWVPMAFNVDAGNNDEYQGVLRPTTPGTYSHLTRYTTTAGERWTYGDLDGIGDGSFAQQTNAPGTLTVSANADQTAPPAPTNLRASNAGATAVSVEWDAAAAADVYRYDVYRSTSAGTGYALVGSTDADTRTWADSGLATDVRYYYVVRAVDEAGNQSAPSGEASAVPQARDVRVTFEVAVPQGTPVNATVYIVGNQPEICNWCNPHTVALQKGSDGKHRATLTFREGTTVEYKYTLGSWDVVEKDASCGEIGNRQLRAIAGPSGAQTREDAVANWRNVAPCGN